MYVKIDCCHGDAKIHVVIRCGNGEVEQKNNREIVHF